LKIKNLKGEFIIYIFLILFFDNKNNFFLCILFFSFNLKKKQNQSNSSKEGATNKKDKEELDGPEYLTNNSGLSFGLNITKKTTKDPKEKRESILAKIKDSKNKQIIDNEGTKTIPNEEIEPEKSLKEQALEELLKG
jgi:hypothetical protein